jgi:tetratricopeptide (TPR) repeat protein
MSRTECVGIKGLLGCVGQAVLILALSLPASADAIHPASFYSWLQTLAANNGSLDAGRWLEDYLSSITPRAVAQFGYDALYLQETGRWTEAVASYDRALALDPDNLDYLSGRGFCNFRAGRYESAVNDLTRVVEMDSLRIGDYVILGRAESENGNLNEAYYWLTTGIELSNDADELSDLYAYRAICYRLAGDYASAHSDLDQAIYWNPAAALPHSGKGELYYLTMRDEEAVESFSKAIELGLEDEESLADVLFQRALSYMELREYDQAVADITELLRHSPERVNAYYYRGLSYFYQGDDDHCTDDLEHFLQYGTDPHLIPEARTILRETEVFRQQR